MKSTYKRTTKKKEIFTTRSNVYLLTCCRSGPLVYMNISFQQFQWFDKLRSNRNATNCNVEAYQGKNSSTEVAFALWLYIYTNTHAYTCSHIYSCNRCTMLCTSSYARSVDAISQKGSHASVPKLRTPEDMPIHT